MNPHSMPPNGTSQSVGPGQRLFANIGGAIITFFAAPIAYEFSVGFVEAYAQTNYGFGGALVQYGWAAAVGLLTFGGSTLALSALPRLSVMGIVNSFRNY